MTEVSANPQMQGMKRHQRCVNVQEPLHDFDEMDAFGRIGFPQRPPRHIQTALRVRTSNPKPETSVYTVLLLLVGGKRERFPPCFQPQRL